MYMYVCICICIGGDPLEVQHPNAWVMRGYGLCTNCSTDTAMHITSCMMFDLHPMIATCSPRLASSISHRHRSAIRMSSEAPGKLLKDKEPSVFNRTNL